MSKQDPKNANEVPLQMHRMQFYFGGESGIPVPGKPELFPNSGEVGGNTNEPCPAAVGDSGMPESDVGKADCVGDISGFIPACIQKELTNTVQQRYSPDHFWPIFCNIPRENLVFKP